MKILIVEDEPDLRETIRISLVKEHFVVETAADYFSALDKVNDYDYDCILLDIMLPGGSGLDLLRELKRLRRSDSVLIISAKDSLDDKVEGLELGADDYLTLAEAGNGCSYPLMTSGKAVTREGRLVFPLSIYVNHAFVDGSHLASFFQKIEEHLKRISQE